MAAGIDNRDIAVLTGRHHSDTFNDECAGVSQKLAPQYRTSSPEIQSTASHLQSSATLFETKLHSVRSYSQRIRSRRSQLYPWLSAQPSMAS